MRRLSIGYLIDESLRRTRLILFTPFTIKKWVKLLFIAFLSGGLGFGGMNLFNKKLKTPQKNYMVDTYNIKLSQKEYNPLGELFKKKIEKGNIGVNFPEFSFFSSLKTKSRIIMAVVIFLIPFIVLFAWLGARFKFIWLNAILNNVSFIKEPFVRYKREGDSLFKVLIILLLIYLVFLGAIVILFYYLCISPAVFNAGTSISFFKIMMALVLLLSTFIVGTIVFVIISVAIDHFVVPLMEKDSCLFLPAWKNFMDIVRKNKRDFLLYLLVIMGLGLATWVVISAITILYSVVLFITIGVLFSGGYLIIATLLKAKIIYIIFSVIFGIPLIVLIFLTILSIGLPFAVFFRSFSLYFLSSLDCGYEFLPLE